MHVSQGEGSDRHIVVSKPTGDNRQTSSAKQTEKLLKNGSKPQNTIVTKEVDPESDGSKQPNYVREDNNVAHKNSMCEKCNKEMPPENVELHQLRCRGSSNETVKDAKVDVRPKSSKSKKKKNKNKTDPANVPQEDFDSIIAAAMQENRTCAFPKCKTLTLTLGQNCEFCAKRYCLNHHIPEVHGCGAEAKAQARMRISRDGVLHRGSGMPSKKPDPTKRAHLQRKLDSKLDDLAQKRKTKPKEK